MDGGSLNHRGADALVFFRPKLPNAHPDDLLLDAKLLRLFDPALVERRFRIYASDRIAVFEATGSAHKWLAVYEGGSHSAFTDWSSRYQAMKLATRELAAGFVGAAAEERAEVIGSWRQRHDPLLARFSGPQPRLRVVPSAANAVQCISYADSVITNALAKSSASEQASAA